MMIIYVTNEVKLVFLHRVAEQWPRVWSQHNTSTHVDLMMLTTA